MQMGGPEAPAAYPGIAARSLSWEIPQMQGDGHDTVSHNVTPGVLQFQTAQRQKQTPYARKQARGGHKPKVAAPKGVYTENPAVGLKRRVQHPCRKRGKTQTVMKIK